MHTIVKTIQELLIKHGVGVTYVRASSGSYDPSTGLVSDSETSKTIKAYPKHERANSYRYPNLIGKEIVMFYIYAKDIGKDPSQKDHITYNSKDYRVDSWQSHIIASDIVLYRILACRG